MLAIFKHEIKLYFQSMSAYVFQAFILFFTGIFLMIYNLEAGVSNFEYVLGSLGIIFVVIVPILTMRVIAEERKQKTDQLLYSLPLSMTEIVLGKYLALLVVYALPLVIISFYPLYLSNFGNVYLPIAYGSLFAFFLLGSCLIAIGMFISSTTENQNVAAGICFAVMLILYYLSELTQYVSSTILGSFIALIVLIVILMICIKSMTGHENLAYFIGSFLLIVCAGCYLFYQEVFAAFLPTIVSYFSLFERFNIFINGTFDVTGIVYYLSILFFFVYLTIQALEKRRYS